MGRVHQHVMLVETFSVTENIILGSEPADFGVIDIKNAEKEVQKLSDTYGLRIDPTAKVQDISVGMQQRVEILKTLFRGADVLIFVEPTAVLTPLELDEIMEIMCELICEVYSNILLT